MSSATLSPAAEQLRRDVRDLRAQIRERHRATDDPFEIARAYTAAIDGILKTLFEERLAHQGSQVALVAVGGYGRNELCPRSDVDLLVLCRGSYDSETLESFIRVLWDGGLHPGHSVRTVSQCYEYMLTDHSTATAMLESRFLIGNEELYGRFRQGALERYRRRRGEAFAKQKLELLRRSLEDPARTIYCIEPSLKEGVCGLRDIQRVLWIQSIRGEGSTFDDLYRQRRFHDEEVRRLRDAYAFYLRVRTELHFLNEVRQDILERDSQRRVARNLGYGGGWSDRAAVEELMGEYYRHARAVESFLRFFLETGARGRPFFSRFLRRLVEVRAGDYLSVFRKRLYLTGTPENGGTADEILEIFCTAQSRDVRLSETLCNWIRRRVDEIDDDEWRAGPVQRSFVRLLRDGRQAGRLLKRMHSTGVLSKVVPEFAALDCLVSFDGHHQFTVDEHTLKTLEELDRIESNSDYPETSFREVLEHIEDRLPLRLALLLHDIGKPLPGSHSVSGTEAAVLICDRLGVDQKVTETVEFLVYRHLMLYTYSQRRDFNEDGLVEELARLAEDEKRLHMLYLLTYIDITSVGAGTWTRWKGSQLADLYQRTLTLLRTGEIPGGDLDAVLAASRLDEADRARVQEHCAQIDSVAYVREMVPERMLFHASLVDKYTETNEAQVALERSLGHDDITFCLRDREKLFGDLAGLLFSEGLNVLGARIFSRSDGAALDVFQVDVADTVQRSVEERVDRIRGKLRAIEGKRMAVEDFVRQRQRQYRLGRWRKPLFGPSVVFHNDTPSALTIVEVSAGDRPGLLFDLAYGLSRLGLDVRSAKVATQGDRAHDVFYVLEADGTKAENPARQTEIRQELASRAEGDAEAPWR